MFRIDHGTGRVLGQEVEIIDRRRKVALDIVGRTEHDRGDQDGTLIPQEVGKLWKTRRGGTPLFRPEGVATDRILAGTSIRQGIRVGGQVFRQQHDRFVRWYRRKRIPLKVHICNIHCGQDATFLTGFFACRRTPGVQPTRMHGVESPRWIR